MQTNPEHSSSAPVFDSTDLSCHFAQMSASEIAQELEQVLDTMTAETYDGSLIDAYLDELDRRGPMPEPPTEEAAWTAFQKHVGALSPEGAACTVSQPAPLQSAAHKRKWRRLPFLAAALIACMLMTLVVAQAAGGDLLNTIISWTDETFHLSKGDPTKSPDKPVEISAALADLSDSVAQLGITEPVMPHVIPDGYSLAEFDFYADMPCINAAYVNGDDNIIISIITNKSDDVFFQKNPGEPEAYNVNGLTFYIAQNVDVYSAVWMTENYCCSIVGVADKDILLEMLNSVW